MINELYISASMWHDPEGRPARHQSSTAEIRRYYIQIGNCVPCQRMQNIHISHRAFHELLINPHGIAWFRETVMVRLEPGRGHLIVGDFDQYQVPLE